MCSHSFGYLADRNMFAEKKWHSKLNWKGGGGAVTCKVWEATLTNQGSQPRRSCLTGSDVRKQGCWCWWEGDSFSGTSCNPAIFFIRQKSKKNTMNSFRFYFYLNRPKTNTESNSTQTWHPRPYFRCSAQNILLRAAIFAGELSKRKQNARVRWVESFKSPGNQRLCHNYIKL